MNEVSIVSISFGIGMTELVVQEVLDTVGSFNGDIPSTFKLLPDI